MRALDTVAGTENITRSSWGWCNTVLFKKIDNRRYEDTSYGEDYRLYNIYRNADDVCIIDGSRHYQYVYHGKNTVSHEHFKNLITVS
jgi:hypothetical protein